MSSSAFIISTAAAVEHHLIYSIKSPNKVQQRFLPLLLQGHDVIVQAPYTQDRITTYAISAIRTVLVNTHTQSSSLSPLVVIISATVDNATQAHRTICDLGGPLHILSALCYGAGVHHLDQELSVLQRTMPHIICGTPEKVRALFACTGGIPGCNVRLVILDEVDQLIARSLSHHVLDIVKLPPSPHHLSETNISPTEHQTVLFSNTVPQDVLNLAHSLQMREPRRVLVRRENQNPHSTRAAGIMGLRHLMFYISFTMGGRHVDRPLSGGSLDVTGIGSQHDNRNSKLDESDCGKLDALVDVFSASRYPRAVIHVACMETLQAVVTSLTSTGVEATAIVSF